ncbi:thylakoid lumenal 15 kDa protein 1, chloroplastic-like, partial [Miscanthus floridulus]|uniref:thylakoid lumenal 15 kDa protein 1, chloroplastic-like n=1 Tax=Miscanthus floridulus TaxID=154761 RepID=UPI0034590E5B
PDCSSPHRSSSPTPPWLSLSARRLLTLPCFCCTPKFLRNRGVDGARAAWLQGGGPYGKQVTRGQDLTGKDFSGLTLVKQDFKTSILRQANFKGANLLGASFFDADLTSADLSDVDLRGADLTKTNLSNANLEGALVTGNTSFKGANITGADFTDVPLRDDQREYLCKIADGVNSTTGNPTKETLFCS